MIRKIILMALVAVCYIGCSAANLTADADSAYSKGDYGRAVEIYKKICDTEGVSAPLLYNLGNAYYKDGDEGLAMVCYLRARRLDPKNESINSNIRFLSSRIEDVNKSELKGKKGNVSPDPQSYFERLGAGISKNTSSNTWAIFGAAAFLITIMGVALYIFTPAVNIKKLGFFSSIIMSIFTLVFVIFAFAAAHQYNSKDEAVIVSFKAPMLETPAEGAHTTGVPLYRGTVLRVLDSEAGADGNVEWYKVRLNSDNIGWIKSGDLEII